MSADQDIENNAPVHTSDVIEPAVKQNGYEELGNGTVDPLLLKKADTKAIENGVDKADQTTEAEPFAFSEKADTAIDASTKDLATNVAAKAESTDTTLAQSTDALSEEAEPAQATKVLGDVTNKRNNEEPAEAVQTEEEATEPLAGESVIANKVADGVALEPRDTSISEVVPDSQGSNDDQDIGVAPDEMSSATAQKPVELSKTTVTAPITEEDAVLAPETRSETADATKDVERPTALAPSVQNTRDTSVVEHALPVPVDETIVGSVNEYAVEPETESTVKPDVEASGAPAPVVESVADQPVQDNTSAASAEQQPPSDDGLSVAEPTSATTTSVDLALEPSPAIKPVDLPAVSQDAVPEVSLDETPSTLHEETVIVESNEAAPAVVDEPLVKADTSGLGDDLIYLTTGSEEICYPEPSTPNEEVISKAEEPVADPSDPVAKPSELVAETVAPVESATVEVTAAEDIIVSNEPKLEKAKEVVEPVESEKLEETEAAKVEEVAFAAEPEQAQTGPSQEVATFQDPEPEPVKADEGVKLAEPVRVEEPEVAKLEEAASLVAEESTNSAEEAKPVNAEEPTKVEVDATPVIEEVSTEPAKVDEVAEPVEIKQEEDRPAQEVEPPKEEESVEAEKVKVNEPAKVEEDQPIAVEDSKELIVDAVVAEPQADKLDPVEVPPEEEPAISNAEDLPEAPKADDDIDTVKVEELSVLVVPEETAEPIKVEEVEPTVSATIEDSTSAVTVAGEVTIPQSEEAGSVLAVSEPATTESAILNTSSLAEAEPLSAPVTEPVQLPKEESEPTQQVLSEPADQEGKVSTTVVSELISAPVLTPESVVAVEAVQLQKPLSENKVEEFVVEKEEVEASVSKKPEPDVEEPVPEPALVDDAAAEESGVLETKEAEAAHAEAEVSEVKDEVVKSVEEAIPDADKTLVVADDEPLLVSEEVRDKKAPPQNDAELTAAVEIPIVENLTVEPTTEANTSVATETPIAAAVDGHSEPAAVAEDVEKESVEPVVDSQALAAIESTSVQGTTSCSERADDKVHHATSETLQETDDVTANIVPAGTHEALTGERFAVEETGAADVHVDVPSTDSKPLIQSAPAVEADIIVEDVEPATQLPPPVVANVFAQGPGVEQQHVTKAENAPDVTATLPDESQDAEEKAAQVHLSVAAEEIAEDSGDAPSVDPTGIIAPAISVTTEVVDTNEPASVAEATVEPDRPKFPWTPSYSVTVQGPNVAADDEAELRKLEQLPPSQTAHITVDTPETQPTTAEPETEEQPKSSWPVSYSVSAQGTSPLHQPQDVSNAEIEPIDALAESASLQESLEVPPIEKFIPQPEPEPVQPAFDEPAEEVKVETEHAERSVVEEDVTQNNEDPAAPVPSVKVEGETEHEQLPEDAINVAPERPWTPSYSVTHQGSPSPVQSPKLLEELEVTEAVAVERPWTPSYSVTQQGLASPQILAMLSSVQLQNEPSSLVDPTPQVSEEQIQDISARDEDLSSSTEPDNQQAAPVPTLKVEDKSIKPEPESVEIQQPPGLEKSPTPQHGDSASPNLHDEGTKNETIEVLPEGPWTPSYSVTRQGSTPQQTPVPLDEVAPTEAPVEEAVNPIITDRPVLAIELHQPEQVAKTEDAGVVEAEQAPSIDVTAELTTEDAPVNADEVDKIERPKSPWISSYSVSRQGTSPLGTPVVKPAEFDSTVGEPIVHAVLTAELHGAVELPKADEVPAIALDAEPGVFGTTSEVLEERPERPWTPSYSVHKQGSGTHTPVEYEAEISSVADSFKDAESRPFPSIEDQSLTVNQKPSLARLVPLNELKQIDVTSPAELDTVSPTTGRARLESTTSSRFFPGGWFSTAPKSPEENRTSLDHAAGEFARPSPAVEAPANTPVDDLDDEKKKGRWCVVM